MKIIYLFELSNVIYNQIFIFRNLYKKNPDYGSGHCAYTYANFTKYIIDTSINEPNKIPLCRQIFKLLKVYRDEKKYISLYIVQKIKESDSSIGKSKRTY